MAIRKPGSRFTDRNTMRKMHAEGYSIAQIGMKLSIKDEHVVYCLEHWSADSEKARDKFKLSEIARLQKEKEAMMLPSQVSEANLRVELEAKIRAELAGDAKAKLEAKIREEIAAETPPEVVIVDVKEINEVEATDETEAKVETSAEVPEAPKRRKRKVAA
jgi:hypothetical protein